MSRKLFLSSTVLFALLCYSVVPSVGAASTWSQTYGGTGNDSARSLVVASDGGYALAGTWNYTTGAGGDFWLVKTDSNGIMEWNRTYGGTRNDEASSLIVTSDGGYTMAGYTSSFSVGDDDFWLVKTDTNGVMEWNKTYGGPGNDFTTSLVLASDGGYAIAGAWNYTKYDERGGDQIPHGDFWLVKTDTNGVMEWNRTYGGTEDDAAWSLVTTSDGGYALAGVTDSFGAGYYDFWLVKTDALGNMQWNRTYGGASFDVPYSLIETSDGGYALVGDTNSFGSGSFDFWLVKTDAVGNMQWNQTYGGTEYDFASSLVGASDGGYAIAGQTRSFGAGDYDFWLVKTDAVGNMQWNQTYGGTAGDAAFSLVGASDGGYAVAGNTGSFGVSDNVWLIKTDGFGVIPEFSSWLILPLAVVATGLIAIGKKRLFPTR